MSEFNKAWLDYENIVSSKGNAFFPYLECIFHGCNKNMTSGIINSIINEISLINHALHSKKAEIFFDNMAENNIINCNPQELHLFIDSKLETESYKIKMNVKDCRLCSAVIAGGDEKGLLYGFFDLIRKSFENFLVTDTTLVFEKKPLCLLRMLDHWDNMDGSIERGYSGNSFFFKDNKILIDGRTTLYARMLASVGINAVALNNVNVRGEASYLITEKYLADLKKLADLLKSYGIKLFISVNFASPIEIGGLKVSDPLDLDVCRFWERCAARIYSYIPDFGGFLVKADSEGRPGPFTYGRTHADGANMLSNALAPYGGLVIWRCFVYNCRQDWRDYKTDRARSAYDNFISLDGKFNSNVILQVKNGPMDFQVREPVTPLFGAMKNTNLMLEVQAAQEYTGQQKDLCFLLPMWKEVLDFNTYQKTYQNSEKETGHTVSDIISRRKNCGICAVSNTGDDYNWFGNDLAGANLYGFGRLSFENSIDLRKILAEWLQMYFAGINTDSLSEILLDSWHTYEAYTAPLGIGWMCSPSCHYGPDIDGYEYDRWGTYNRADCHGIGIDRSKNGTGYASLYNEPNVSIYENVSTTPDELLLFFHHVPYMYILHSGSTVIQHIYDTHFYGADKVKEYIEIFGQYKNIMQKDKYDRIMERFKMQLENAIEWRDRVNTYFYRMSGINDRYNRKIY